MRPRAPLTPSALTGSVLTPSAQIRWWVAHAAVATTALLAVALAGGCGTSGVGAPPATGSGGDASGPPSGSGPVQSTPIGEPCDTETRCAAEPNADSACVVQECTLICHAGFADCDRVPTNGCEQSLLTTTSCGGCFIPCDPPHAFGSCLAGLCGVAACDLGWGDCDADPGNGCETPLVTATNCAACGTPCAVEHGSGGCNGGVCAVAGCEAGWADCDGSAATGCERALGTDADCGACGDDCSARAEPSSCQAGVCAAEGCEPGWGACDADPGNGCETELVSLDHCGACDAACAELQATAAECIDGVCELECEGGFGDCDGIGANGCEEPVDTGAHCGACGVDCALEHTETACVDGECVAVICELGWGDCDDAPGCEASLVDVATCGACHIACAAGHACLETGACEPTLVWSALSPEAELLAVALDPNGNVIAAGGLGESALALSRAPDGGPRWTVVAAAEGGGTSTFHGVAVSADGDAVAVGAADGQVRVLALSALGDERWALTFGGDSDVDAGLDVGITPNGTAVLAGRFKGPMVIQGQPVPGSIAFVDPFVVALESDGSLGWALGLAGVTDDDAQHVAVDASGDSFVCGRTDGLLTFGDEPLFSPQAGGVWLASFDGDGDARWAVLANGVLPTEAVVDGLGVGGGLIALAKAGGMQAWSAGVGGPSVIGLGAAPAATDLAVAPDGRVYAVAPKEDGVLLTAWTDALAPRWTFVVAGSFGSRPRVAVGTAERIAIVGGSSIARVDDGGWAPAPAPAQ